ncbi:MAG: fumarylacetoacetate hydrolase family protein [Verrucomicrobiota bacterium]
MLNKIYRVVIQGGGESYAESEDGVTFSALSGSFPEFASTGNVVEVEQLLAPVAPPAVYIIGYNYAPDPAAARKELGDTPVVVMKAPTTVVGPGATVRLPPPEVSSEVDYEGELAIIIGRPARNVCPEEALDYVFGYTIANDLTARDLQRNGAGGQWVRGKNLDDFCPLGPCVLSAEDVSGDPFFSVKTFVNGELRQNDNTSSLIFSIPEIIAYLSSGNTLYPGTVILTGTPAGTGVKMEPKRFLAPGDEVRIEIDCIGELSNYFVASA